MRDWNNIKAIIFDLDDTLYSERQYVFSGFKAVSIWLENTYSYDSKKTLDDFKSDFLSCNRGKNFDRWASKNGLLSKELISEMIKIYRNHIPKIKPFPGIVEMLTLIKRKVKLGLVSDGYLKVQQLKLASLQLEQYFDAIIFSDQLGRKYWKPSIKPYLKVLDKLEVDKKSAIYVADNPLKDFKGPNLLGMKSVRVRFKDGNYLHMTPPAVEYLAGETVNSITKLSELLENLLRKE